MMAAVSRWASSAPPVAAHNSRTKFTKNFFVTTPSSVVTALAFLLPALQDDGVDATQYED